MRLFFITALLCCFTQISFAQAGFKRNDIYLEAGGNGLFVSVNYARQLTKTPGLGAHIGVGFYSENSFYLTIPAGINYLFPLRNKKSFIDAGLGVTWARVDGRLFEKTMWYENQHYTNFIPSIGYRRHTRGNVIWRVNVAAIANRYGGLPWLGAAIGKRF